MWEWLEQIFGQGFMPHGHCYRWSPAMVWTQVSANLLTGVAYAAIASTLALLVRRIQNIPFAWVYLAFGTFILSCGLTHFFDVITVWHPVYWADAGVRVVTATASLATAVLMVPLFPKAVAFANAARISNERGRELELAHEALSQTHARLAQREREAQQRVRSTEGRLRSLVETMPQLAWISDPEGITTFRNARWQEYSGLTLADPADAEWDSLCSPETVQLVKDRWREALESKRPFEVEAALRRVDGEYRWFLMRALPSLDDSGNVLAWMGTCTDIHDQRLLHQETLHTARLKDEFLATVSHELRTPLNAILGWSRILRDRELADEKKRRALESIERNAVAQTRLVDDLLEVSRIVSGKLRIEAKLTNPADAVEAALDAVRPAAMAKGVALSSAIDREAGQVIADPGRIQQIIWNLVGNAIKFTPPSGQVLVSVQRVHGNVEIEVSDTGVGIKRDFVPHLFERFSQEDGSIRRSHGGLGLGLAITKHLVELHGGDIRAQSEGEGRGSTFVVMLPAVAAHIASETAKQPPLPELQELRGLRLLLVEDDLDSRDIVTAILEDTGIEVSTAGTAEQALELLGRLPLDVILSDIGLPGKDGYSFIKAVRKDPLLARTPAAALTAYAHAEDRQRALDAGFQLHLPKPFEEAELFRVITELAALAANRNS